MSENIERTYVTTSWPIPVVFDLVHLSASFGLLEYPVLYTPWETNMPLKKSKNSFMNCLDYIYRTVVLRQVTKKTLVWCQKMNNGF